jgi:CHASE2 domain-containing sensor protein
LASPCARRYANSAGETALEEKAMNNAVHQLLQLILQGITWAMKTAEVLWTWSWSQIASVFTMSWGNLPPWKLAVGIVAILVLGGVLVAVVRRAWDAFGRIAAAFWTMAVTLFGLLAFVVAAGLFSRGFQWVVASVPDKFWEGFI